MSPAVTLRPLAEVDLERVATWIYHEDVRRALLLADDAGQDQAAWFRRCQADPSKRVYAIEADGVHVGNIALFDIDPRHGRARLSIFIGDPAMRGRGIGSAALKRLFALAFSELGLSRVWLEVLVDNEAALRCYAKAGMIREGTLRGHVRLGQGRADMAVFAILGAERHKENRP